MVPHSQAAGELRVQFLHIEFFVVRGGSDAKRTQVSDELEIDTQGECIGQLDPPSQMSLHLLSIRKSSRRGPRCPGTAAWEQGGR
jgi:hypothetical protein